MAAATPFSPECKYALAVRQPWAWAIVVGHKDVENRSERAAKGMHKRALGQRIYIHASAAAYRNEFEAAAAFMANLGIACPHEEEFEFGGYIGTVRVADIAPASPSPWYAPGATALILDSPRPCAFLAARGQLGLFDAEHAVLAAR